MKQPMASCFSGPTCTPMLQLTTPLSQPTVNDSGHQDVPCYLVALDGSSLGREYIGIPLLAYVTIFLVASLNAALVFQMRVFIPTKAIPSHRKERVI